VPDFTPIGATVRIYRIGPPKLTFLLSCDKNVEYKRPAWAYPLSTFTEFAEFIPRFRMR